MRLAVTGAGGRLGQAVLKVAPSAGHEIIAIDRAPVEGADGTKVRTRTADITDYDQFLDAMSGADALIHLAAYTHANAAPEPQVHNNNVVASYNALAAAQAAGITRVCLASSINAIGGVYSKQPRYDYFPVDEAHPNYAEDSYSLSKWILEEQAAAFARRLPGSMSIVSLRFHALRQPEEMAARKPGDPKWGSKDLWGHTPMSAAVQACLNGVTTDFGGSEVFYVVGANTYRPETSQELRDSYYPDVPIRGDLSGHRSFFDSSKAVKLLRLAL